MNRRPGQRTAGVSYGGAPVPYPGSGVVMYGGVSTRIFLQLRALFEKCVNSRGYEHVFQEKAFKFQGLRSISGVRVRETRGSLFRCRFLRGAVAIQCTTSLPALRHFCISNRNPPSPRARLFTVSLAWLAGILHRSLRLVQRVEVTAWMTACTANPDMLAGAV